MEAAVEADGYASFAEGSSYTHTSRNKFLSYRNSVLANNSAAAPEDDTETVVIKKTSTNRGTEENPYVINSFSTWKKFSDEMINDTSSTTWGDGKYYVLACDLDFSQSTTIRPTIMYSFGGTLYGLGHTIKNYNVVDNPTLDGHKAAGMFRWAPWQGAKQAMITDVNLEYSYSNVWGEAVGAFFGYVGYSSSVTVLNCHTKGTVNRLAGSTEVAFVVGGMVGGCWRRTVDDSAFYHGTISIYRCSSQLTVTMPTSSRITCVYVGGMIGGKWDWYNLYVYDCYGDVELKVTQSSNVRVVINGCGAILGTGSAGKSAYSADVEIIRCAGKSLYRDALSSTKWDYGSLFGLYDTEYPTQTGKFFVRDCYVYGTGITESDSNTRYFPQPWAIGRIIGNANLAPTSKSNVDAMNVYFAGDSIADKWKENSMDTVNANNYHGTEVTPTDLWTSAKADTKLHSNIWTKSDLSQSYIYTVETSPVRNKEFEKPYKIRYYNLKKSGSTFTDEEISSSVSATYTYTTSSLNVSLETSPTAPTASHEFKGWTTDKSGATAPKMSLDVKDFNGDLKVYAVWEIKGVTPVLEQSGGTLNPDTNTYEAESGGTGINLTAKVGLPADLNASDYTIVYYWQKNGAIDSSLGTDSRINRSAVGHNGTYSFGYTVTSSSMPLVTAKGVCRQSLKIEITGKSTSMNKFELTSPAYAGALLKNVTFDLVMVDGNTPVSGTAVWQSENYQIQNGTNRTKVIFTPDDLTTYRRMTLEVEFEATPLTLTFAIPDIRDSDLVVEIEYGQPYSAQEIVEMFEAAYLKKIEEDKTFEISVNNRTPKLDGVEIDRYNTAFQGALEPKTITVTFTDPKDYIVNLNYGFENKGETVKVHWNQLISEPNIKRGEEWVLNGWFITENGVLTTEKWDFKTNRVTHDVSLTASWTQVVLTLTGITVTPPRNPFTATALTPVESLGLTVTATYSSTVSDEPIVKNIPMRSDTASDGFVIKVGGIVNGELHVSTTEIVVDYLDQSKTVSITVTPIDLDGYRNQINFPICTKDYTGSPQEIDPLYITQLPKELQPWVADIVITYERGGIPVDKSEVVGQGTYTAKASFVMSDNDHTLSPITTRFIISPPRLEVTVSWGAAPAGGYSYNGSVQHPTATLTASNGTQLNPSQFEYVIVNNSTLSKSEGRDAGSYTVNVAFPESVATIYKFGEGANTSTTYTINRAKVNKPVPLASSFEYTGSEIIFELSGFEESYMTFAEKGRTGINVGSYVATVTLDGNHEWTEGGQSASYSWTITKAKITRPSFSEESMEYSGFEYSLEEQLAGFDPEKMIMTGGKATKAGSYTANVTPSANYTWDGDSTPVKVSWTITKAKLLVDWEPNDTYEAGTRVNPKVVRFLGLRGNDKFDPEADADKVRYGGDTNKNTVGAYIVKVSSLMTDWADNYEIDDLGKGYRIIAQGADPDDPNNPVVPDPSNPNGGGNMGNNGGNMGNTPSEGFILALIPIILSGISLVLIIVFAVMTLNYNSAAKAATDKAKRLAKISYSFAPAGLLAVTFGLSVSNWWIIAGVLMGLALVMAIVAFTFKGKKRKALLMLEEEQERVAEEKELAKEEKAREEQARRDNELRMMFASMQQNYQQPQMNYGDMQNMIASTVSALLPGLQQQMALPPASPDGVYAQPAISAAAQIEIDGLHAQIAQQNAQMAQQREMMEQILQNQQAQQAAINEALYEEPEPEDDISWLGENDEVISLEESYGALSDEGKRAYYEIGSYIMNKPRTSQNDGRYAVLFKYRGRTVFKLAIKDDAPVLYYPTGSRRSEVRVYDAASLEVAKSMIDRTVISVDSRM